MEAIRFKHSSVIQAAAVRKRRRRAALPRVVDEDRQPGCCVSRSPLSSQSADQSGF